jgi:hypothetical protein
METMCAVPSFETPRKRAAPQDDGLLVSPSFRGVHSAKLNERTRNPEQCMVLDSGSAPKRAHPGMTQTSSQDEGFARDNELAIFRKQSRHRQSPPSSGIGSRAVSSAHQQGPDGLQENSVPQAEQERRRVTGSRISNRFVMNGIAF